MRRFSKFSTVLFIMLFIVIMATACGGKELNIVFDVDGATYHTLTVKGEEDLKIPDDPLKDGYDFTGWYLDSSLRTKYEKTLPEQSITVYAGWKAKQFVISFNSNGGSAVAPITQDFGTAVTAPASPTKSGYTFDGWYNGDTEYEFATMPLNGVTLAAQWMVNEYTITFDSNGGALQSGEAVQSVVYSEAATAPVFEKAGYTFASWDKEFDNITAQVTVMAQWTVNEYTIAFESNEGSAVAPITEDYGSEVAAPANPERTGYNFGGWYTDDETFEIPYVFDTIPLNGITVYADWSPIDYYIIYNLDGGGFDGEYATEYTVESGEITLTVPKKTAYDFLGWYAESELINEVEKIVAGSTGDKAYFAGWQATVYAITYNLGGGGFDGEYVTEYTVESQELALAAPKKTAYDFIGWYTESGYINIVEKITAGSTGDKEFFARWQAKLYSITYYLDGGEFEGQPIIGYTIESAEIVLQIPQKDDCTFVGWYLEATFDSEVTSIPAASIGNKEYYANWDYALHFDISNGGDTQTQSKTVSYGESLGELPVPEWQEYVFNGWNTELDGSGMTVTENSLLTEKNSLTVYAVWYSRCLDFSLADPEYYDMRGYAIDYVNEEAYEDMDIIIPYSYKGITVIAINQYVFAGLSIRSISFPSGLRYIAYGAFNSCSGISAIDLPDSLDYIEGYAFNDCTSLLNIDLPANAEEISNEAFYNTAWYNSQSDGVLYLDNVLMGYKGEMPNAFNLVIDPATTQIASFAFYDKTELASITFPENTQLNTIGFGAFMSTGLTEVEIPAYIKRIKEYAFDGNATLTALTFSNGSLLEEIGESAFTNCDISSLTIPNAVRTIGDEAFYNNASLSLLSFAEGSVIAKIGSGAFFETNLATVEIPDSITIIGEDAFAETPWFNNLSDGIVYLGNILYACINRNNTITENYSIEIREGTISIADGAFGSFYQITEVTLNPELLFIGYSAFSGTSITEINLPSGLKKINEGAFADCQKLTQVTIPATVEHLGEDAFEDCRELSSIMFEPGSALTTLSREVFSGTNIESIDLPQSISIIEFGAFESCWNLLYIDLPDLEYLGQSAFAYCSSLIEVTFAGSKLDYIDEATFTNSGLQRITLPEGLLDIYNSAFQNCKRLESIQLPSSLSTIGHYVFFKCVTLAEITIPSSVVSIGEGVFGDCLSLEEVIFESGSMLETIEGDAFYASGLQTIALPEGLTTLSEGIFEHCTNLISVILPSSIENIEWEAFGDCTALELLIIPESVTSIATNAFVESSRLVVFFEKMFGDPPSPDDYIPLDTFEEDWDMISYGDPLVRLCYLTGYSEDHMTEFTFNTNGGGEVDGIMANILFELPAAPLKEKCTFLGWSLSQDSYIPVPIPFFTHYITTTCYAFWEDDFSGDGEVITFVYDSENDGYTVTAVSHPFYQRQIAIPETYDDGTNGEKPVFRIGDGTNPVLAETLAGGTGQNQIAYLFLPQSIKEISDYAFANSPLRQIIFSEGLETIGVNAFNNCSLLEGVLRLPSTLSYIGEAAFAETPNIKEVVFAGSSLEYLGEWAFANSGLTFINLPDVEILSEGAFYNCRLLREISIPSGVKEIGAQVFYGTRLYSVTFEESIIDGIEQGIIFIGDQAFACNTRLYEIHFPVTIKVIGEVAFSECENLTIVTFAEGTDMIGIGAEAFAHCALLSIDLPSGLAEIADYTFNACFYLNSVYMPDTVTHIGAGAFKQTLLKEISLSSGLVSIGDEAFVNTLLQRLVIPASVESIGLRAFGDDDYLSEVIFEEGSAIQTIGEYAFEWCPIIYVSLPNGLITIGSFAFSYCEMSEIFVPESVVFIGDYAFNNCSRLSKLTFADRSQLSPELKSISIGQYAFQRTGISQVILPEGLNSLSSGIFNECKKLKSVEISDESVSIGAYAFSQCVAMLTLTLYGAPPDLNTLAFNSMNSAALIYVLVEFLNAYKTASVWSTYADRIFEMPQ